MPEVLGDAGVYFDPENPIEITSAIKALIGFPNMGINPAQASFERAQHYSWALCSNQRLEFLAEVALSSQRDKLI